MKAVLFDDQNIVTNIIVWDDQSSIEGQSMIVVNDDVHVSIGWKVVNGSFEAPQPEIPIQPQKTTEEIIKELQDKVLALEARI